MDLRSESDGSDEEDGVEEEEVDGSDEEEEVLVVTEDEGEEARAADTETELTAEEAVRQAAAEGLTLQLSNNEAGYKGVWLASRGLARTTVRAAKKYQTGIFQGGKKVHLGTYPTAEEAALVYARTPKAQAQAAKPAKPPQLSAQEALAQATAEGLQLQRSDTLEPTPSRATRACRSRPVVRSRSTMRTLHTEAGNNAISAPLPPPSRRPSSPPALPP